MGTTLYRTYARFIIITGLIGFPVTEAKALVVECPGCVASTNAVQTAVETGNATLESVLTELGVIKNYLNQIRLAIGPASTTSTVGTLSQAPDFLNLSTIIPSAESFSLEKGVNLDFSNLTGLKDKMNDALRIYNTAQQTKAAFENGKFTLSPADITKVLTSRNSVFVSSAERALRTSLYSLGQIDAAKSTELSLDSGRRSAFNIQMKLQSLSKTQGEVLTKLNHLISLMASQIALNSAETVKNLPTEIPEFPPPARNQQNPNNSGDATILFNGGQ